MNKTESMLVGLSVENAAKKLEKIGGGVRLGTADGGGFLYIGDARGCHPAKIADEYTRLELEVEKEISELNNRLKDAKRAKKTYAQRRRDVSKIAGRKVVEAYRSCEVPNTQIVIIRGKERGPYWTLNEYENKTINVPKEDENNE